MALKLNSREFENFIFYARTKVNHAEGLTSLTTQFSNFVYFMPRYCYNRSPRDYVSLSYFPRVFARLPLLLSVSLFILLRPRFIVSFYYYPSTETRIKKQKHLRQWYCVERTYEIFKFWTWINLISINFQRMLNIWQFQIYTFSFQ